jgi:YggT family protein
VSALSCQVSTILLWLVHLYVLLLVVYALLSWIPDLRGSWTRYLAALVEPLLMPVRRIIPPLGGLDISFLVVILAIQFLVVPLLVRLSLNVCYVGY